MLVGVVHINVVTEVARNILHRCTDCGITSTANTPVIQFDYILTCNGSPVVSSYQSWAIFSIIRVSLRAITMPAHSTDDSLLFIY